MQVSHCSSLSLSLWMGVGGRISGITSSGSRPAASAVAARRRNEVAWDIHLPLPLPAPRQRNPVLPNCFDARACAMQLCGCHVAVWLCALVLGGEKYKERNAADHKCGVRTERGREREEEANAANECRGGAHFQPITSQITWRPPLESSKSYSMDR